MPAAPHPTLEHALDRYCRYHDIMGDFVQPRLQERAGALLFDISPGIPFSANAISFGIAAVLIARLPEAFEVWRASVVTCDVTNSC